ncbi:hypothetical protein AMECASPLE_029217 [Ameca splendens]|uniref:B30.2/SPRY domain-containing protein n=1 Tax=Ameca splendens TaxID=208324 RepID=A0ABV0ZGD7_9TELE
METQSKQLPDNPERNTNIGTVFGFEGFSSGKHSWEVEVGDNPDWSVGLVKQTIDSKRKTLASPKDGIWCLQYCNGKYTNGISETITVRRVSRGSESSWTTTGGRCPSKILKT